MALFVLACIGCGKDVSAAEWALKGALGQALQYNDNIAFSTLRKESVVGYLLTPSLQATRKTGALDVGFQGQGDIRRYNDTQWDCDNYNLGSNNAYRSKRSVFSLSGGYAVTCNYAQQVNQTGILLPNQQSVNYRLAPSWTWQWTSRDQLILGTSYYKTSYSNSNSSGSVVSNAGNGSFLFSGNDTYSVNLTEKHQWSRRLSLDENLFFSNVQYTGSDTSTQNLFGFQLGANYIINRFWTASAGGGLLWVDTQQPSNGVSSGQNSSLSLDPVANISLSYKDQLNKFSTGYTNTTSPSSIGQSLQTQSVFASYSYQIAQHLLLDISGNYTSSQSIGGQSTDNLANQFDRIYFTATTGITWELAKNWQLKGRYVYSRQDQQGLDVVQNLTEATRNQNLNVGTSDSNVVTLSLNYLWDGIRKSR